MSGRDETQREVFVVLLGEWLRENFSASVLSSKTRTGPTQEWQAQQRREWLQRFDKAATRTAAVDVFVEALSERLKDWLKEQATETAQWKSVKDELPPVDTDVLIVVVDAENTSNRRIVLAERTSDHHKNPWYDGDYFYEDYEVAHWRELPTLPMEVLK